MAWAILISWASFLAWVRFKVHFFVNYLIVRALNFLYLWSFGRLSLFVCWFFILLYLRNQLLWVVISLWNWIVVVGLILKLIWIWSDFLVQIENCLKARASIFLRLTNDFWCTHPNTVLILRSAFWTLKR